MPARQIPVWVELVVPVTVTPTVEADGSEDFSMVDLDAAVRPLLPDTATLITATTTDQVEQVMNQEAADLAERINDAVAMLKVLRGAVERDISTPGGTVNSLTNIITFLTLPPREVPEVAG